MEQLISNDSFLITGGSGMIGSQIKLGIKPSSKELNILIPENIEKIFKKYKPKILLHLAALTDIKKCELKPKLAYEINVKGTLNIVRACDKYKTKLIYISTCAVFNGKKKKPYTEKDVPCPFSVYGKTKLEGEKFCRTLKNYLVVRTGWVFGNNMPPNKFVRICFEKLTKNERIIFGQTKQNIDERHCNIIANVIQESGMQGQKTSWENCKYKKEKDGNIYCTEFHSLCGKEKCKRATK